MSSILFVQPVFLPDEKRLQRNFESVKSLFNYLQTHGNDGVKLSLIFGGWAMTDELWNSFINKIKEIHSAFSAIRFDKNVGKAVIVNTLISKANEKTQEYDYIFTADSDILFPITNKHMFKRLILASEKIKNNEQKEFGLLGLNQLGDARHYKEFFTRKTTYNFNEDIQENILFSKLPAGIAGGALFLSKKAFLDVNGYRVMAIYSGDDAYLLQDMVKKNYSIAMIESLSIYHPPDDDKEYDEWKEKNLQKCRKTNGEKTKDLNKDILDAESFWRNRK